MRLAKVLSGFNDTHLQDLRPEAILSRPETPVAVEPNEGAVREAVLRPTGTVSMLVRLVWLTGVLIICTRSGRR